MVHLRGTTEPGLVVSGRSMVTMMMGDVFRVSLVVGAGDEAVAELFGFAGGVEVPVGDPVRVPAEVLVEAAGVDVCDLPGMVFVPSGGGWVPAGTCFG